MTARQPKAATRLSRSAAAYTRLGHKAMLAGNGRQAEVYYRLADRQRRQAQQVRERARSRA